MTTSKETMPPADDGRGLSEGLGRTATMQPRLTVRVTSFPESNGKRNWTALLVRVEPWRGLIGNCGGITIARGELWNRVAYEAECARALLGARDTEPHILDYGDDIKTPEEWAGEVRGGRFVRPNALGEGRERGLLREASSGEAATSTDGLEGKGT